MILDYSNCSLESLYEMLREQEASLEKYRAQEPSTKRKHRKEHDMWVAISQAKFERIHEIREEIIKKQKENNNEKSEYNP